MTRVSFGFREPDGGGFNPPGIECERYDLRSNITQLPLGFMVEFDRAGVLVEAEHLVEILNPPWPSRCFDTSVCCSTMRWPPRQHVVGAGADG